jgi:hypothetical protein
LTREGLIGEESKSDNSRALHSNQVQLVKKYPEDTIQENRLDYLIKEDKKQPQFATSVHQSFWKQVGEVEQIEEQVREFLIPKKSR